MYFTQNNQDGKVCVMNPLKRSPTSITVLPVNKDILTSEIVAPINKPRPCKIRKTEDCMLESEQQITPPTLNDVRGTCTIDSFMEGT